MDLHPGHFVAIFGGACAGSEAAYQLAKRGIYSVVFEKNALPYGKIEDGLPKWHVKLRNKEEKKIDDKISESHVSYIPNVILGKDVDFEDVVRNWGFSAIMLAIGAWRDRPMPIDGIEDYIGKGFYYQNPYVDWFNHYHEPDYSGPQCEIPDDTIIVGGGLASIDVVKILMLETARLAMEKKGLESNIFVLEKKGIPKILEGFGLSFNDLGIRGCTLYYRRRAIDMPLASPPPNATGEQMAKTQMVRQKILQNAQSKYCFRFEPCSVPVDKISEGDRIKGLVFLRSEIVEGRVMTLPGTEFEVRSPLVISSIGSIPEPTPQVPMQGELFEILDENTGKMKGFDHVFALGNAVTGRGNIKESEVHARLVANHVMDNYLGWSAEDFAKLLDGDTDVLQKGQAKEPLTTDQIERILDRIGELQGRVGYHGDYQKWAAENQRKRLEDILGVEG